MTGRINQVSICYSHHEFGAPWLFIVLRKHQADGLDVSFSINTPFGYWVNSPWMLLPDKLTLDICWIIMLWVLMLRLPCKKPLASSSSWAKVLSSLPDTLSNIIDTLPNIWATLPSHLQYFTEMSWIWLYDHDWLRLTLTLAPIRASISPNPLHPAAHTIIVITIITLKNPSSYCRPSSFLVIYQETVAMLKQFLSKHHDASSQPNKPRLI